MIFAKCGLAVLGISLMFAGVATAQGNPPGNFPQVSISIVDESADGNAERGPSDDDRVPNSTRGIGMPGWLWLKRDGRITGQIIAEAHVGAGADGQPVVQITFTPEARAKFAALTRAIIGHHLAFVVNGAVVSAPLINAEMNGGKVQISGYYSEMEARDLAAEMMASTR
jgi:preprotein translocase subunit SecD